MLAVYISASANLGIPTSAGRRQSSGFPDFRSSGGDSAQDLSTTHLPLSWILEKQRLLVTDIQHVRCVNGKLFYTCSITAESNKSCPPHEVEPKKGAQNAYTNKHTLHDEPLLSDRRKVFVIEASHCCFSAG